MTAPDDHPSSEPPSLNLGKNFHASYELLAKLGSGGMGVVYKARDRVNNKLVAVKTIRMGMSGSAKSRFQLEAQVLQKLRHPHIIPLFDFNVADMTPYMVLEYVEGKTLAEVFADEGQLEANRILHLFLQACDALTYAHAKGVLHRDIKPGNFLIAKKETGEEHLYLMDFGIAKVVSDQNIEVQKLTSTGDIIGTPTYISPEQSKAEPIDERSDLYSLGCVMYEALTGSPPFISDSLLGVVIQHRQAQPPSIREASMGRTLDPRLNLIVDKLLQKDRALRFQTASDLKQALLDVRSAARTEKVSVLAAQGKKAVSKKVLNPTIAALAGGLIAFALLAFFEKAIKYNSELRDSESKASAKKDADVLVRPLTEKALTEPDAADSQMDQNYRLELEKRLAGKPSRVIIGNNIFYAVTNEDLALLKTDQNLRDLHIKNDASKNTLRNSDALKLEILANLPLRILHITDIRVANWQALRKFKHLESLWIKQQKLDQSLISSLSELKNITYLRLEGAPATDVDLRSLVALKKLQLLILPIESPSQGQELLSEFKRNSPNCVVLVRGGALEPGVFKKIEKQGDQLLHEPSMVFAALDRYNIASLYASSDPLATEAQKIGRIISDSELALNACKSVPQDEEAEILKIALDRSRGAWNKARTDKYFGPITGATFARAQDMTADYEQTHSQTEEATSNRQKAFEIAQRVAAQFDASDLLKESRDRNWQNHRLENLRLLVDSELKRQNQKAAQAIFDNQLEPLANKLISIGVCAEESKKLVSELRGELHTN